MAEPWPRHPGHGSFAGLIRMTIRVFVPVGGREGLPSVLVIPASRYRESIRKEPQMNVR
jgi:hypothetical protein